MTGEVVLIVHAGATWLMTGVIWFVQLVHYPLMGRVGREGWVEYERQHQARTTWIVAPAMLTELATAVLLTAAAFGAVGLGVRVPTEAAVAGLALLAVVWGSTFGVQVPQHSRLTRGFDAQAHRALVRWNWPRTVCWSGRAAVASWMLLGAVPA